MNREIHVRLREGLRVKPSRATRPHMYPQLDHMRELLDKGKSQREVAELLNVSPNAVWRMAQKGTYDRKSN